MASLIDELINVLNNEYEIYRQLIPIADEKTQIIVRNDLDALQVITGQEQTAVDQLNACEKKRAEIMTNIKTVINRRSSDMNLAELIQLLDKQPKEQKALTILHDNLKGTIQTLVENNNRNTILIQQSLEMIEFNMNFIQSTRMMQGDNTYTKSANGAQLLGTGMFDAKQ